MLRVKKAVRVAYCHANTESFKEAYQSLKEKGMEQVYIMSEGTRDRYGSYRSFRLFGVLGETPEDIAELNVVSPDHIMLKREWNFMVHSDTVLSGE
jgi:hypothetical protein